MLAGLVARLGGVASLAELKEIDGVTAADIHSALDEGGILRLHRTKVALPDVGAAQAAALRTGGNVSHLSAALTHGWKVVRPPVRPTITVSRNTKVRRRDGLQVHYSSRQLARPGDPTAPVDTVIDCARSLDFVEALAVADSALRSRAVGRTALIEAAQKSPRSGRSRALRVVRCADRRAHNPFESALRGIALDVPGFTAQAQCPVPGIGHPDVGDPQLRIALEADSYEYHALREAFSYDVRRYTAMVRSGWLVARFTWDDVMHRAEYVAAVIADLAALRARS